MRMITCSTLSDFLKTQRENIGLKGASLLKSNIEALVADFGPGVTKLVRCGDPITDAVVDDFATKFIAGQKQLSANIYGTKLAEIAFIDKSKRNVGGRVKGRSKILTCTLSDEKAKCPKAVVKIIADHQRFAKEKKNTIFICGLDGGAFVRSYGFDDVIPGGGGAHMMEEGLTDLKGLLAVTGPLRGKTLNVVAKSMSRCVALVHRKNFAWGDLRLENFVVCARNSQTRYEVASLLESRKASPGQGSVDKIFQYIQCGDLVVKGIDLESAVMCGCPISDISPEIIAPEQVDILSSGELSSGSAGDFTIGLKMDLLASKKIDIWALGISILHLYLGKAPIADGLNMKLAVSKVSDFERNSDDEVKSLGLSEVKRGNRALFSVLSEMLHLDPRKRPGVRFLLFRYFLY